jgi:hypothetical protein
MGGGKQTTTQSSEPWKEVQPMLKDIGQQAQNLYKSGKGFDVWQGDYVAPQSQGTQFGINSGLQTAMNGSPLAGQAVNSTSNLMANNGLSRQQRGASGLLGAIGQGFFNNDTSKYDQFTQPGNAYGLLNKTAQGEFLNANPYLDKNIQDTADSVNSRTNALFAKSGRFGSGSHSVNLANTLGTLENNARLSNYQTERQNMLSAQNALGGLEGQQLGALNSQFGANNQNLANMMSGATGAAQIGQQGIGNMQNSIAQLPTIDTARYADAMKAMGFGAAQDQYNQSVLQGEMDKFNQTQQSPFQALQAYQGFIDPMAKLGGTATSTSKSPSNALGYLPLLLGAL